MTFVYGPGADQPGLSVSAVKVKVSCQIQNAGIKKPNDLLEYQLHSKNK